MSKTSEPVFKQWYNLTDICVWLKTYELPDRNESIRLSLSVVSGSVAYMNCGTNPLDVKIGLKCVGHPFQAYRTFSNLWVAFGKVVRILVVISRVGFCFSQFCFHFLVAGGVRVNLFVADEPVWCLNQANLKSKNCNLDGRSSTKNEYWMNLFECSKTEEAKWLNLRDYFSLAINARVRTCPSDHRIDPETRT